jgi:hypothetical protein
VFCETLRNLADACCAALRTTFIGLIPPIKVRIRHLQRVPRLGAAVSNILVRTSSTFIRNRKGIAIC